MTRLNSNKVIKYLLYLIFFILTACAEQPRKHVYTNEIPPAVAQVPQIATIVPESSAKYNGIKEIPSRMIPVTVWDRLFSLYALPEVDNERIEKEIQRYLKHPEYLTKIQQRAEPYLYFILDEIEARQLPGELALLPVVESAFLPNAISQSKASGLWQFMPATGRFFGLKQNWWYDGRNDIASSTRAATKYLDQLGKLFDNDWFLAIASYNAGKGTVRKAQRKNRENNLPTDYWSISWRKETMNYVPRLLAIAKIFANAERYNIPLLSIANNPHFTIVDIESQIDLSIAAKMAELSTDDFFKLNPAYKRWSTDPDGPYQLLIPTDKADNFKQQLAGLQKKDRMRWLRHKIHAGENLGAIANKYNTTVNAIRQSNHLANNNIRAGKYLLIPGDSGQINSGSRKKAKQLYIVKKGDTFWDIARQFSVRSKDIAQWNNLSLTKMLQPGQKLIIKEG